MRSHALLELRRTARSGLVARRYAWAAAGVDLPPRGSARGSYRTAYHTAHHAAKRCLDVVLTLALLPLALPLLLACAVGVKAGSPGHVFEPRERTGRGGRRFRTWWLRTTGHSVGTPGRSLGFGGFLRRTHLDALPELFSVLRGDMSLVGPRPDSFTPDALPLWYTGRFEAKPGITGLAQISSAAALHPEEAVRLDLAYVRTWTIALDVRILARSVAITLDAGYDWGHRALHRLGTGLAAVDWSFPARPTLPRLSVSVPRLAARSLVVADIAAAGLALTVAYVLRFQLQLGGAGPVTVPPASEYFKLFIVIAAAVTVIAGFQQLYRTAPPHTRLEETYAVAKAVTLGTALALATTFFYRDFNFSRLAMGYFWVTAVALMATTHALTRTWLVRRHGRGLDLSRTIVVGRPSAHLLDRLQSEPEFGLELVGCLGPADEAGEDDSPADLERAGVLLRSANMRKVRARPSPPRLGNVEDAPAVLARSRPDRVMVVEHGLTHAQLLETIDACERNDIQVQLIPPVYDLLIDPTDLTFVNGVPALRIDEVRSRLPQRAAKRLIDIAVSGALLLVLAPFLLGIVLLIRRSSPGPALFRQTRGGKNGRAFEMLKFRTMVSDAEARLVSVIDIDALDQPAFKVVDDPRITPVGRWLRRFSLDELPQLINVLKGEMTLVGPRPEELRLVERYDVWQRRRLKMKPGITGLQQVVARGPLAGLAERVQLDIYYTRKHSLLLDLVILFRTVGAVISGRGAT